MNKQAPILTQAARFLVSLQYSDLPSDVTNTAKRAVLDYIGVAIAGCDQPVAENLRHWASQRSQGGNASIIGHDFNLDVENAALVNAASGHALDFDDTSWATIGHPSTVIIPALLALAEEQDLSGKALLTAYIAGVEVAHKVADLMMPETSENGWHTTGVFYTLGTAAAVCQLLDLDEAMTTRALALSLSRSSGIRSNFGTQAKPYHAGMAAKSGLEAVSLAQHGITSAPTALEGVDGFIQCYASDALAKKVRTMVKPILFGVGWDISTKGYAFKKYPNCSGNHPACDLMETLVQEDKVTWQEIESIHCGVSLLGPKELVCHQPKTPVEARFSLEYSIAASLIYGQLTLEEFTQEKIMDPRVQSLMQSITMEIDDDLAKLGFIGTAPVKIWIKTKTGDSLFLENDLAIGNPEKPFSDEDFRAKFAKCVAGKLSPENEKTLLNQLFQLEQVEHIKSVTQLIKRER
ncbi:MmgE/PrpD family protein [Marinomonas sp. PE14-40]|uniref:MmgE/PrpD family protein n=1 Tax=Marinomonas sp. PE14-40 TaxID=3060621 RepID=UPI003F671C99